MPDRVISLMVAGVASDRIWTRTEVSVDGMSYDYGLSCSDPRAVTATIGVGPQRTVAALNEARSRATDDAG